MTEMRPRFTAAILNVGHGNCAVFVDEVAGEALVVDCGRGGAAAVQRYLPAGVTVKAIILTHLHWDHIADVERLLEAVGPAAVRWNYDTRMSGRASGMRTRSLLLGLRERVRPAAGGGGGDTATVGRSNDPAIGEIDYQILAPGHEDVTVALVSGDPNLAAAVLTVTMAQFRILLCSDASQQVLEELVDKSPDKVRAHVVVAPHHGGRWRERSGGMTLPRFHASVSAEDVIFSVAYQDDPKHPRLEQVLAAGLQGRVVLCTQVTGLCHSGGGTILPAGPRSFPSCAADVVYAITDIGTYTRTPTQAQHDRVVDGWADEPACRL